MRAGFAPRAPHWGRSPSPNPLQIMSVACLGFIKKQLPHVVYWYHLRGRFRMTKPIEVSVHMCQCASCQTGADAAIIQQHQRVNLFLSRLTEPQRRWYVGLLSQEPARPSDAEL